MVDTRYCFSVSEAVVMPAPRSHLWNVFVKSKSGGKCKLCQLDVKTSGNTTNLKKHLARKHPKYLTNIQKASEDEANNNIDKHTQHTVKFSNIAKDDHQSVASSSSSFSAKSIEDETDTNTDDPIPSTSSQHSLNQQSLKKASCSRQSSIIDSFALIKSFSDGGTKAAKISNALVFMIAKDSMPINSTEKEGFKYFMKTICPMYKLPGRKKIANLVDEKYGILSGMYKQKLKKVSNITITTDVWTEIMTTTSFLGVTAHFLFEDKLHSLTVGVYELSERHTAAYLGQTLLNVCDEWGISNDKITAVVTDNGANIVKAVTDIFGKNRHLPCFAHTLDLVATKIISDTDYAKTIVDNVKSIVTYFKQSITAADELRRAQPPDNVLKLIQSVPTRWNSVFYSLERFVKLYKYIVPILLKNPKSPKMLDAFDLEKIQDILNVLSPIEELSKEICGEKYLTSSKVIPIINCFIKKIENFTPSTEEGLVLKKSTLNEISKRFGAIEHNKLLAVSTILDPRFKRLHFNVPTACASAVTFINQFIFQQSQAQDDDKDDSAAESTLIPKTESVWAYHEELAAKHIETQNLSKGEFDYNFKMYLNSPTLPINSEPFEYWKNFGSFSLHIKKIAHQYLSVVATSVPTERLFSKAGNIITSKRSRLGGDRLSELVFLNSLDFEDWNL